MTTIYRKFPYFFPETVCYNSNYLLRLHIELILCKNCYVAKVLNFFIDLWKFWKLVLSDAYFYQQLYNSLLIVCKTYTFILSENFLVRCFYSGVDNVTNFF